MILRVHFGLGKNQRVKIIEIRWPSGQVDTLNNIAANQVIIVEEKVVLCQELKKVRSQPPKS